MRVEIPCTIGDLEWMLFRSTRYWTCDCISMLELKSIHAAPGKAYCQTAPIHFPSQCAMRENQKNEINYYLFKITHSLYRQQNICNISSKPQYNGDLCDDWSNYCTTKRLQTPCYPKPNCVVSLYKKHHQITYWTPAQSKKMQVENDVTTLLMVICHTIPLPKWTDSWFII